MGRRARTNCSPVDSVLEKYHNDIGNRLSGVFIPPPTTDSSQGLSEDFCMLTLDLRRVNSLKHKPKAVEQSALTLLNNSVLVETANKESRDTSFPQPEAMQSPVQTETDQDSSSKDRPRLVDKLTRALFQKKHVCARCKRKSRSCLLNKTFSATEKRYTCGRCRENASALKNLFDGQTSSADSNSISPVTSTKRDGSLLPQPRTCNDSGYETVTSCSTVASSYSAFNTPNSKTVSIKNIPNSREISEDSGDARDQPSSENVSHQQNTPSQQETSHRLPAPHEYDGYLPDFIEFRGWNRQPIRPCSQGDALDHEEECAPQGGVMCVRRPASLDSSPQPKHKACHTCGTTSVPCFRLPWEGGWLCEDCMDGVY